MKVSEISAWLDNVLDVASFDDVSNNGVQIACREKDCPLVAFAVDASARAVKAAAAAGAGMLVVHHGVSWGGGIKRIEGGLYSVVKAAIYADIAVYACHLPLDAHPLYGNNACLVKELFLESPRRAFTYRSSPIGFVAEATSKTSDALSGLCARSRVPAFAVDEGDLVGVCSGGAGDFAEEAKRLGCSLYVTGEAGWGDVIAAENCSMRMICLGHYATEVFGVRALSAETEKSLGVKCVDLTGELA